MEKKERKGKRGEQKKRKKRIQPASVTSDDVTAKRFLSRLDKEGVEREEEGEETARAILSEREISSGL